MQKLIILGLQKRFRFNILTKFIYSTKKGDKLKNSKSRVYFKIFDKCSINSSLTSSCSRAISMELLSQSTVFPIS